jgi:AAA ATPase domain
VDPVRNPYAPGAGQRPPELAGREGETQAFDVLLERVQRGRPDRSVVLTGLRGVGKTVLLNALRSAAVRRGWGTGKIEIRPDASLRRPLAAALHPAIRELGAPASESTHVLGILKSFAQREVNPATSGRAGRGSAGAPGGSARAAAMGARWQPGIDVPAVPGRADSGDIEIDLVELLVDLAGLAGDTGKGIGLFIDEMQDLEPADVSALCAACHEVGQRGLPLVVVGAGLPHLPAVLSASKSYSERLFRYNRIDRLDRAAADIALQLPARDEGAHFSDAALDAMYALTSGYPYFVQAYGKAAWDCAPGSPITEADVALAAPGAEAELAVGFFGARYERATPAEREYLRAMADLVETGDQSDAAVATAAVAGILARPAQSLSPARDALLKKGLVYSGQRGQIAFTVPHFGRYLRTQD